MSFSDPLGDLLTRIRNGQGAKKATIASPWSKERENVCAVLKAEGFIREYRTEDKDNNKRDLIVELKYSEGKGAIREIHRVSKPGRRVYSSVIELPRYYNGLGVVIVSTPQGVMADHQARAANVGGEVLCQVF